MLVTLEPQSVFGRSENVRPSHLTRPMLCANDWIVRSGVAGMAFAVCGLSSYSFGIVASGNAWMEKEI